MDGKTRISVLVMGTALILAAAPFLGGHAIGWADVTGGPGGDPGLAEIFWRLRVPRTLVAILAGAALALGGVAFQALFRNPLAEPFILGVSSGASAGVAVAVVGAGALAGMGARIAAAWPAFAGLADGLPTTTLGGFAGALAAIALVYAISRRPGGLDPSRLLLAGVALSFVFSSVVMLLQYLAAPRESAQLVRALMGGVATAGYRPVLRALPFVLLGGVAVLASRRELDLLACGEDLARTRGVDVRRVRRRLFLAVSLMTAGVTALCGPIGFVGLMVPHGCRRWLGPGHGRLAPASAAAGAAFLTAADAFGRVAARPEELPVGLVTALLGGPFFLILLLGNRNA